MLKYKAKFTNSEFIDAEKVLAHCTLQHADNVALVQCKDGSYAVCTIDEDGTMYHEAKYTHSEVYAYVLFATEIQLHVTCHLD